MRAWWQEVRPKHRRYERRAMLLALSGFIVLIAGSAFAIAYDVITLRTSVAFEHTMTELPSVFQKRADELRAIAGDVGSEPLLQRYLREKDLLGIQTFLIEEYHKRGIGGLAVTDEHGVILARSRSIGVHGDNVYLDSVWGPTLAAGESVSGVFRGITSPLIVLGATPIMADGVSLGSMLAIDVFDDATMEAFAAARLPAGAFVVAYTPELGVVSDSLEDEEMSAIVRTYFHSGTDKVRSGKSDLLYTHDDKTYVMKNLVFAGTEESPGGLLLFFPRWYVGRVLAVSVIGVFIMACVLVMLCIARHRHLWEPRVWMAIAASSLATGCIVFVTARALTFRDAIPLSEPEFTIYNSTLELYPSTSIVDLAYEQRIAVRVRSGGEKVNSFTVHLRYDPAMMDVLDIVTTNSICDPDLFAERRIDVSTGEVLISCGLPNPGFSGAVATIAELVVQPRREGAFAIRFEKDSKVLANDGLGTNVLRIAPTGSYQAVDFASGNAEDDTEPLILASTTHPNSALWYRKRQVALDWSAGPSSVYAYAWTRSPDDQPSLNTVTTERSMTLTAGTDGAYYFHLAPVSNGQLGAVAHRIVLIDRTPPADVALDVGANTVRRNEHLRLRFSATDALSGLQPNYYLKIDDGAFFPVVKEVQVSFAKKGKHKLTLRVYDMAGNVSQASSVVTVKKK